MKVVFLKTFKEDIEKFKDQKTKVILKQVIDVITKASSLQDIESLNKLKGYYSMTYRMKIGPYRLGLYYQNKQVYLARCVKKEDVIKVFPDGKLQNK